ncbi:hypothetical protein Pelo_19575 [Pelomyxa schiedti]|nr:hypothetical protein Pelo_19575 [Pelomyxa schiedti]
MLETSTAYDLGYCFNHGYGVEKDTKKAVELFHVAVASGDQRGMCSLGRTAAKFFRMAVAAAENDYEAQGWLNIILRRNS